MIDPLNKCPECGGVLLAHAEGLCPACVMRAVVAVDETDQRESAAALGSIRYLGNYELLSEIARGGMGIVYRARQTTLNRDVAVKLVNNGSFASAEMLRRFRSEAEVAASLDHPQIVPIYEVGEHDGLPYFSMGLIEGVTLAEIIVGKPLAAARTVELVIGIAQTVQFAHERGILHRDLKPTNILIDREGTPHLTDFGLAKLMDADTSLTRTNAVMGTPAYMAPEQARGDMRSTTTSTDVYSIGAILYHCLTGHPPFEGETSIEVIQQVVGSDPTRPSHRHSQVDRDLEIICLKCLEKEPQRRYASASALAEDLQRWQRGEPIHARPATAVETFVKLVRRHPVPSTFAAIALLILVVGVIGVAMQWRRAESALATAQERLYATDIHLAQQALAEHDRGRVLKLLQAHAPRDGARDLRGMEWRYLWAQAQGNEDQLITNGVGGGALSMDFSPGGHSLAISVSTNCEIWDVKSGTRKSIFEHAHQLQSVAFDSKGERLVTCDRVSVTVWNVASGEPIWSRKWTNAFRAEFIRKDQALVFTYGTSISVGSLGSAVVLSAENGNTLQELNPSSARGLAVSPDGSMFATGMRDAGIQLWEAESAGLARVFTNSLPLTSLAFTPDGQRLVAGCWNGYLQEWDVASGKFLREAKLHRTHIWTIAINTDGTIYTGSGDHTCRAWDGVTWTAKRDFTGHRSPVFGLSISSDGGLLAAAATRQARIWKIDSAGAPRLTHQSVPYRWVEMAMPAGEKLILQSPAGPRVVDRASGREIRAFTKGGIACDFFEDENHLLLKIMDTNNPVVIWNYKTGDSRAVKLDGYINRGSLPFRALAPGQIIQVHTNASIWDASTGKIIREFKALDGDPYGWRISPNREFLVAGGLRNGRGVANVIRLADGKIRASFTMGATVEAIAFNKEGTRMGAASWDHSVKVFSFPDMRLIAHLQGQLGSVYNVAFTMDSQVLSGAEDGTTVLWDLRTGLEMMRFPYQYCSTLPDGAWVFGGKPDPRTGEMELHFATAPSLQEITAREPLKWR